VGGVERVGNVDRDVQEALKIERSSGDEVLKGMTLEKLHGDEATAVVFANFVNGADVRVIQC